METFTISSSNHPRKLVFSNLSDESVDVACGDAIVFAQKVIFLYRDATDMARFFERMASKWKGWLGALEFASIEQDLKLSASTDSFGHVTLAVTLSNWNSDDVWEATMRINLESGSLEGLAKAARHFFAE